MSDVAYMEEKDQTNADRPAFVATSSTTPVVQVPEGKLAKQFPAEHVSDEVLEAVLSYVQAVRTLGRLRVTATEVSDALSLKTRLVVQALEQLEDKGVKKKGTKKLSK